MYKDSFIAIKRGAIVMAIDDASGENPFKPIRITGKSDGSIDYELTSCRKSLTQDFHLKLKTMKITV
jgi:hypothetical protein